MSIAAVSSNTSAVATTPSSSTKSAVAAARAFNATLGQLNAQIDTFESQTTWRVDHDQAITLPTGVASPAADSTAGTTPTTSQTIGNGFADLEASTQSQLTNLTPDQQAQFSALQTKLSAESTRFQGFIGRRQSSLAKADHHVDAQAGDVSNEISDFESQITWQIDHGQTPTAPNDLKTATSADSLTAASTEEVAGNASSGNASTSGNASAEAPATTQTLAQTISNGFAAIESDAASRLKNAPWQFQAQFQKFQQNLTAEATRFSTFATARAAYRAANPKAAEQDVTA